MIYKTLEQLDSSQYHSLFIRHAERYSLGDLKKALSVLLTDKGKKDSYELGQSLNLPGPINLYHSPVERCKQTAENIKKGLDHIGSENSIMGYIHNLGGPYVKGSWEDMVNSINQLGFETFVRKWFDGYISGEIVMPLEEAAHTQLEVIVNQLKENNSSSINVSHDWNLMLIREYFFKLKHEDIGLPIFLDGIASYLEGSKLSMIYQDKRITLSL